MREKIFIKNTDDYMSDEEAENYETMCKYVLIVQILTTILGKESEKTWESERIASGETVVERDKLKIIHFWKGKTWSYRDSERWDYWSINFTIKYNGIVVFDRENRFFIKGDWEKELQTLFSGVLSGETEIPAEKKGKLKYIRTYLEGNGMADLSKPIVPPCCLFPEDYDPITLTAKRYLDKCSR